MATKQTHRLSYLLRLWQAREEGAVAWRASLQSPGAGQRLGFATLEELFGFLRKQTAASPDVHMEEEQSR